MVIMIRVLSFSGMSLSFIFLQTFPEVPRQAFTHIHEPELCHITLLKSVPGKADGTTVISLD